MLLAFSLPVAPMPGDAILSEFRKQQHMDPHRNVVEMIEIARAQAGFCRGGAKRAIHALGLDAATKIGRLGDAQLADLASAIRRHCRRATGTGAQTQVA